MLFDDINWGAITKRSIRQNITQAVAASYALFASYMIWKFVCVLFNNDFPVVCVLSESMEPGFARGDILFVKTRDYKVGEIAVWQVIKDSIPIVHRIIKVIGERILTKGDNNKLDDVGLYRRGQLLLEKHEIRGTIFWYIPFLGIFTIWISTVPMLKQALMLYTAISVFYKREDTRGKYGV